MGILSGMMVGARAAAIFVAGLAVSVLAANAAECAADKVDVRGEWGSARFTVEIAITPEEQARGLMFRESMRRMAGMLFVYDATQPLGFWMRNTLIPLDMIFIDETGTVVKVHAEAQPRDETVILSGDPARAVLEINGGMAATLGIGPGDQVRSPAMPQDTSVWSCE